MPRNSSISICRPDIAKMNFDYITYSTPNGAGSSRIEDPALRNSPIAFPDPEELANCETLKFLGDEKTTPSTMNYGGKSNPK